MPLDNAKASTSNAENSPPPTEDDQSRENVAAAKIKMQSFFNNDPELWFVLLEAQFETRGIRLDKTKYYAVINHISQPVAERVKDILRNPPLINKYTIIKQRLIKDFADSETSKLKKLLSQLSLGDDKPSNLLHKMKTLAADHVGDEVVKQLWIERLPKLHQAVLAASGDELDQLGEMADRIHETSSTTSLCTVDNSTSSSNKNAVIERLEAIEKRLGRLEGRSRDKTPSRSRSMSRPSNRDGTKQKSYDMCWYHHKFGSKATKCDKPCKYHTKENDQAK